MTTYDRLAELPLRIKGYDLEGLSRTQGDRERLTTVIKLRDGDYEGCGEDVTYDADSQRNFQQFGQGFDLAGDWTIDSFSRYLDTVDLFPRAAAPVSVYRNYRRWGFESAALDLALRQAGQSLAQVLELEPAPIRFVASPRLGSPPDLAVITKRLDAYPGLEFKLDALSDWDDELLDFLAHRDCVAVVDFKGAYKRTLAPTDSQDAFKGTPADVETDPELYRRVAAALPDPYLEDPDLTSDKANAVLEPYQQRISWDAPIHSVTDILKLPFQPQVLNIKPSRFGSLAALMDTYDFCADQEIITYGGGQSELGVGRDQIQYLASLFHPDGPNDIAPIGYDLPEFPLRLPHSPLAPQFAQVGFAREAS